MAESSRWSALRLLAGLGLAPVVSAAVAFVAFPLVEWTHPLEVGRAVDGYQAAAGFALVVGFVAAVVTLVVALPVAAALQTRGRLTLQASLIAGLVIGNAPYFLISIWLLFAPGVNEVGYGLLGAVRGVAIGTVLGVSSAAAFWMVAGPRKSQRLPASPEG